jgi:hypothetical protein
VRDSKERDKVMKMEGMEKEREKKEEKEGIKSSKGEEKQRGTGKRVAVMSLRYEKECGRNVKVKGKEGGV